jgi:hypothetical protein
MDVTAVDTIKPLTLPSLPLESDFFRGRWDWQCGKMTQCQILSNLSSTSFIFLSWALVQ